MSSRQDTSRRTEFRAALGELARIDKLELGAALRAMLAVDAEALRVTRVSYWELAPDRSAIVCRTLYRRDAGAYDHGGELRASAIPAYFGAMLEGCPIAIDDALSDPRTRELVDSYLRPHAISSMLDVPVWRSGKLAGVLCHEHVGPARAWTADEQTFVRGIGSMVSAVLDEVDRARAEQRARFAAITSLAAGVAHEINNPLTYITANLTTALEDLDAGILDPTSLRELLRDAHYGAERVRHIVHELVEAAQAMPPPARASPPSARPDEARRRVLLVDDEAPVRQSLRRMLASAHDVVVADDGASALATLRSGLHVDVVVCDLMMPQMTGMELYAHLVEERPELARRTIFMTGGAFTADARAFLAACDRPLLEKPIDRATLRRAIASV